MKTAANRKIFPVLTILLLIGLFVSGQAFAWTKTATFESGSNGALAQGSDMWDYSGTVTTVSTDIANSGTKSSKMVWSKGTDGFNRTHAEMYTPSNVGDGGEIWFRAYYYFPASWSWSSNSGSYSMVKIFRTMTSGGGACGVVSDSNGAIVLSNEPSSIQPYPGGTFDKGRWQAIEVYIKSSSTSTGIVRVWKDGVLAGEIKGYKTLASSSNTIKAAQLMAVWNNGVGNTQTQYVDDFVMTTDTPSQRDSHGNAMIGLVGGNNTTPPTVPPAPITLSPPTGLRLTAN